MSLLLGLDTTQIILICLIAVLLIAYPILMVTKNKKENQRITEQTNSLKRGDKVLTTSGVYGKIIDIKLEGTSKQITIETGSGNYKSYMTIDAYAIYSVIKDEIPVAKDITKTEEKTEDKKEEAKTAEEPKEVATTEEKTLEEKKPVKAKAKKKENKKA